MTKNIQPTMGADNHTTVSIEAPEAFEENVRNAVRREDATDEWQVWISRDDGEDIRTELTVDAPTSAAALDEAYEMVTSVVDAAVGPSYLPLYRLTVRRVIE